MKHTFDVEIAEKYGINCAILIDNLYFWIKKNEANGTNYYDGKYWTYNSVKAFRILFPYLSARMISNALSKLEEEGLIITGNYNQSSYDRTKWYALTDKAYSIIEKGELHFTKVQNGNDKSDKPIPDNKPDSKPSIKHIYGEFKHVKLSDDDISKLKEITPDVNTWIKKLDEYIENTGKKYQNHYLTLRNWINKDKPKNSGLPDWYDKVPTEKASPEALAKALELQKKLRQQEGLPDWWNEEHESTPPSQDLLDSIAEKEKKLREGE